MLIGDVVGWPTDAVSRSSLDWSGTWIGRVGDIAFIGVGSDVDGDRRLRAGINNDIGDAVVSASNGGEIRMQVSGESRRDGGAVGINGSRRDIGVPCGGVWERDESVEAGVVAETHGAARGGSG